MLGNRHTSPAPTMSVRIAVTSASSAPVARACLRRDGTCDSPSCRHRRRDPGGAARPVRGDALAAERRYDLRGRSARLPRRNDRRRRRPRRAGSVLRRARCVAALPAPRCRRRARVRVAAARELVEEAGVLLARRRREPGRRARMPRLCAGGSTRASRSSKLCETAAGASRSTPSCPSRRSSRRARSRVASTRTSSWPSSLPGPRPGPPRPSPTSSCGRRSPRRSAGGLTGEIVLLPPTWLIADAARAVRLGRRRARVGEGPHDRAARAEAHRRCGDRQLTIPVAGDGVSLLLRGRPRLAPRLASARIEPDSIEATRRHDDRRQLTSGGGPGPHRDR